MLGSAFEAEDAVQETFIRAWRGYDKFEGRAQLRSWLYRIATNVCLDMLGASQRRARPMDLSPALTAERARRAAGGDAWIEPIPDERVVPAGGDPADVAVARERPAGVRRRAPAPAAQAARGADPARGPALAGRRGRGAARDHRRVGEQRAAAGAGDARRPADAATARRRAARRRPAGLLARYVEAFERYDMDALTSLLHEDATLVDAAVRALAPDPRRHRQVVPGARASGAGARGSSRRRPTGRRRSGSTSPTRTGGLEPWSLQVLELRATGSPASRSSSTPSASSRCSACRRTSTDARRQGSASLHGMTSSGRRARGAREAPGLRPRRGGGGLDA